VAVGESRYANPDGSLRDLYFNFVGYYMELSERLKASR
jgi:hypothetical protein